MKLVPTLPTKLSELFSENEWRSTNDGKDFLLGNYFFMTTWHDVDVIMQLIHNINN